MTAVILRWLGLIPLLVLGRAARVRISVGPRKRYWAGQNEIGLVRVVALGDSLTQGIGSSGPDASWLGRYLAALRAGTGCTYRVDNRAVYGAKVADVLADQLPLPADVDRVVLCIGANDAGRTEPALFRARLRRVCDQLPAGSLVGDVPEFQWGLRIKAAAELSAIVRTVVAEYPLLVLAEVERTTTGTKILTELAGDFFHPADSGYRRIANAFVAAERSRQPVA